MTIEGTLEDIIFRNEENGYTVAVLEHGLKYTTIVGVFLSAQIGMMLRLHGKYAVNKKFGEQFAFESFEIIYPNSVNGIKKYLASGLIKGVGEKTAELIVQEFKENTFTIIEYDFEKLALIKGISLNKAKTIHDAFSELKKFQNTLIFLQQYNITASLAMKIFAIYGENTISKIKQNPYCLVEDIDGVGFLSADRIARSMGIDNDSLFRLRAATIHLLNENSDKSGHTYIPKNVLLEDVCSLLNFDSEVITQKFDQTIESLCESKIARNFFHNNQNIVMLNKLYFVEYGVAQKLAMMSKSAIKNSFDASGYVLHFEQINKIKFHEQQKNAIISSALSGVSVITGGPGTGKTTIVKCILQILKAQNLKCMLMAPTGRAAKRLCETTGEEAKTIHRSLIVDFQNGRRSFVHNEKKQLCVDCVIVDEVSMVDVMLMSSLTKALPRDCKLILVGDKDQLPSVGAGNVLADIIESGIINVCNLTEIFRQDSKSLIVKNAHLINSGVEPILDNSSNDFFYNNKTDLFDIKNTIVEMVTSRIPNFMGVDPTKIQVMAPLKAGTCGVENLNKDLQENLNHSSVNKVEVVVGEHIFREGDKVMQTSNNYELEWVKQERYFEEKGLGVFNGDIGYILKINQYNGETTIVFDDNRKCVYPRNELSQLSLAYAITIHKSQGSEFDVVVIPLINGTRQILTKNLIYTAITRAKKMVVLIGEKSNLMKMVKNTYTQKRFTLLCDFLITCNQSIENLFG